MELPYNPATLYMPPLPQVVTNIPWFPLLKQCTPFLSLCRFWHIATRHLYHVKETFIVQWHYESSSRSWLSNRCPPEVSFSCITMISQGQQNALKKSRPVITTDNRGLCKKIKLIFCVYKAFPKSSCT